MIKKLLGILLTLTLVFTYIGSVTASIEPYITNGYATFDVKEGVNEYEVGNYEYYLSYKAEKTGYATFTFDYNPGRFDVRDTKIQHLSNSYESIYPTKKGSSYVIGLAVKKGETYLFDFIKDSSDSSDKYKVTVKNTTIKFNNTSKKKAAKIKMKKTKTAIIPISHDKDVAWFKFKFKKTKKCTIYLNTKESMGEYQISILKGKKLVGRTITGGRTMKWNPFNLYNVNDNGTVKYKLKKGTYHIKFEKYNDYASGKFTIKIK